MLKNYLLLAVLFFTIGASFKELEGSETNIDDFVKFLMEGEHHEIYEEGYF